MRIAIVAPSSRFSEEAAARVREIAAAHFPGVELFFHPQCFLTHNHFAGTDQARADALVEVADDPAFDAIWFARGGYGACRIAEDVIGRLGPAARDKTYLGYSDAGYLLAGLYRAGFKDLAHGPLPQDAMREGGKAAVVRALGWLVEDNPASLEPGLKPGMRHAAFNITVFGLLLGTPLEPDLSGHVLLLEDVSEHDYRIDRAMFHITATPSVRRLAGIRLGRVSDVPANDPDFGEDAEAIVRHWCARADIPFLGRADIGHDAANTVVPFGLPPL
ncbi:LD-carboxypeptidase [Sphingosinicella sp. LHD-64]|uniref:LD-carboxypeptidase n=1 Tax=Sphingosinicella sp. LHD-64 TaxID=3072139 RepID=UPI00281050BC|nr:LD-carboxypeptidase [Sphingosinicella sp. LHD-64]MDQ8755977.1 LD-carboxypeptidase [Sphingosinicella sp. LHD-64]